MAYDLYPAVDETYDFPPEIRQALARSLELRNDVEPMTTAIRNNLLAAELWDGRTIANTTTDRLERYDAGTLTWKPLAEASELLPLQQSLSVPTGFRNVIRNGDMQIAQRGNGPFPSRTYTLDGWQSNGTADGTVTVTRLLPVPGVSRHVLRAQISGTSLASDYAQIYQRVEDVATLSNTTVTTSFKAKAVSGTPKVSLNLVQNFGVGGSPSAEVAIKLPPITISTSWATYSVTATVPSIVGKTLGTTSQGYFRLSFWLSAGANWSEYADVGIQNNTFDIADVQVEEGSVATPFERLPIQQQLEWCERYLQKSWPIDQVPGTNNSVFPQVMKCARLEDIHQADSLGLEPMRINRMRTSPTVAIYTSAGALTGNIPAGFTLYNGTTGYATALSARDSTDCQVWLEASNSAPIGASGSIFFQYVLSAEL
jgi:Carbohydrate binding domain